MQNCFGFHIPCMIQFKAVKPGSGGRLRERTITLALLSGYSRTFEGSPTAPPIAPFLIIYMLKLIFVLNNMRF